uniref:collagen alpha-1(I) chain-like n=1 Tax=Halichoerus grypus TaxID=9711 RepID=UPI001659C62E|nr:collagen alpha-1(I) chain-like [Halichoerus grypus]
MTHPRAPPRKRDLSWPSGDIPGPQSPGFMCAGANMRDETVGRGRAGPDAARGLVGSISEADRRASAPQEPRPAVAMGLAFFLPPRSAGDPCNSASLRESGWKRSAQPSPARHRKDSPVPGTLRPVHLLPLGSPCLEGPLGPAVLEAAPSLPSREPALECSPNAPRPPVIAPRCRKQQEAHGSQSPHRVGWPPGRPGPVQGVGAAPAYGAARETSLCRPGQGQAQQSPRANPPSPSGGQGPPPSPLISACLLTAERGQCA